ncbi:MAG: 2-C-methyl-D-erythritol 2,4-cyclodiphosphate synthase [Bacteroidetes bacterium]|nr:2-C-methyl-D-erythritol 2,4-cyclodiphosphate synthase [Bacteroidota bacterium]MBL7103091.1 2-C-methyl-D-erythritol 2,4-cyclodiphosphate synthase [Bacteroidales bacterium]
MKIKVGFGFDVHKLKKGADLWIGGVKIQSERGAVGYSDADVLIHAICDALLGAINLRDIGFLFPDTDPQYKGIDSKKLLTEVCKLVAQNDYSINNIDSTVCLEQPKISSYIPEIKKTLAETAGLSEDDISVKATTTEELGFTGRAEGIAAYAIALVKKK